MIKTNIGRLRFLAIVEGISYLAFAVTMPVKYYLDILWPNKIVGGLHGIFFIAYCLWVFIVKQEYNWGPRKTILALLASLIPFGTFWADKALFQDPEEV